MVAGVSLGRTNRSEKVACGAGLMISRVLRVGSIGENMIAEMLKTLLETLKLAPRYLVALGAAVGILLFSNDNFLRKFSVLRFTEE